MAQADGLDWSACVRMLRQVFRLSLIEAKEVTVVASGQANSLVESQEKLIPAIAAALDRFDISNS
jgi:hypothetical protein